MAGGEPLPGFCRDCDRAVRGAERACLGCGGVRLVRHREVFSLGLAHIDADAFYASVEKQRRPELRARPLIVGGGVRGVVAACCYIARLSGVRSAMPMFKARALCPAAVVLPPDIAAYREVSHRLRAMMESLTPLVQPLSIDEAVLDLAGTAALHGAPPAIVLARLARRVEAELGITISVGLAPNRLLAKLAAERDKPRGFFVFGAEAPALLAAEPVSLLPGVGAVLTRKLGAMGITRIGHLAALDSRTARARLGEDGPALAARARFEDARAVETDRIAKSISAETTFETDITDRAALEAVLWRLCEKLARRLREAGMAAAGVTLKLKTAAFRTRTRAARLPAPTLLPETLFAAARALLAGEATGTAFRLIGIGATSFAPAAAADRGDLADAEAPRRRARQEAIDRLRARFGDRAIGAGRGLPRRPDRA